MKHSFIIKWVFVLSTFLSVSSCKKEQVEIAIEHPIVDSPAATAGFYSETFESAAKASYETGKVLFTNGTWTFTDALVGNTSADPKTGLNSARLRNNGKITMDFDLPDGAKAFTMSFAKYNRDKNAMLQVYYSTDAGSEWASAGPAFAVTKTDLESVTYTLDITGPVRFEIRKTDGADSRVNIDDIKVEENPVAAPEPTTNELTENYETGVKTGYAAGQVTLASGNWNLAEALIGTLDADRKTGAKSVRIRDLGMLEMQFDVNGATEVSISHAVYGTDAGSNWQLEASTNGGVTWAKVGNTVSSASTTLQTINFAVNYTSAVRFRVVKLTATATRINIDDFKISGIEQESNPGEEPVENPNTSVHLTFGNPSGAKTDVSLPNNYLLEKTQFVMSYSRDKGTANWVSWHLDEPWIGSTDRQDDFRADNTLPSNWYQVSATDYRNSGFDRGHMCPSADRTYSVTDNSATFFMTNMIPQAPRNNQGAWATLEGYCRTMLSGGYEVYIISGGYGVGGTGSNGYATTIANGKVTVPANTWKVILIMPDGTNDVARVTTSTRVIAVDMPNDQSIASDWRTYRTTVDAIEAKTGYDFFNLVNDTVEKTIEAKIDAL